ncbi:hypothetical protein KKD37_04370 [Patescibacteria group bacterium]|nr:hypothetical protein [Patescibacteria group bacterium]
MIKGKLWSHVVERLTDLTIEAKDKMIMVKKLDDSVLMKAEVIGVKGIICLENDSDEKSDVVIKKVSSGEWKKLR